MKWCALNMNEGRRQMNCCCDEYWLQFPWTNNPRGVRGSPFLNCYFAFVLLCALHLLLCVCVPSVRGADTTDRSRRMCMRWSLVCRSCLLLPPPSVCWCCGRAVCVCVPAAVDWSVCRAWCAAYGACLAAALSSCGVPSVCVCRTSRLPCCSPCPSLCRSAPHHRTTTLTMMTCRLLCALLVLALCCCPSVCAAATGEVNLPNLSSSSSESQVQTKPGAGLGNGMGGEQGL
ncbi:mucin TcMUC [Trypanosoma cruzi]|uniref:Mucin TcMUC n=1 Tax=Trypanosoma cruzi TaxID=5693 RepID=A0A7J6Y7A0_TRYCR|nr:mucin TcMUC [Trypanosoma cruzi]